MDFEKFRQILSEITIIPVENLRKDASFREELHIDSLQMVNLLVELTSRLGDKTYKIHSNQDLETVYGVYQMFVREEVKL
jgi:acyl carrier protein